MCSVFHVLQLSRFVHSLPSNLFGRSFAGTGKKGAQVSDLTVGEGASCEWQAAAMDKETTIAFYFEVTNQHVSNLPPGDSCNSLANLVSEHASMQPIVIGAWSACL